MRKPLNLPLTSFLILFTTLAITGLGGMMVVTMRQQIASSARRLQNIEEETTRLERLNEELRTKIAMLENPTALKMVATKLGMQPAKLDQYRLMGVPARGEVRSQAVADAGPKDAKNYAKGF